MKYAALSFLFLMTFAPTLCAREIFTVSVRSNANGIRNWLIDHDIRILREVQNHQGTTVGFGVILDEDQRNAFVNIFGSQSGVQRSPRMHRSMLSRSEHIVSPYGDLHQWGQNAIQASIALPTRPLGNHLEGTKFGAKACVLDTGVAWDHPALAKQVTRQESVVSDICQVQDPDVLCSAFGKCALASGTTPSDFEKNIENCEKTMGGISPEDLNQYCEDPSGKLVLCAYDDDVDHHGTHVAGIIGARNINERRRIDFQGVAPADEIIAVKASMQYWLGADAGGDSEGYLETGTFFDFDVAAGIYACMRQDADVINMSFAGLGSTELESAAVAFASGAGAILVASAGNGEFIFDVNGDPIRPMEADETFPAAYDEVLSVSPLDPSGTVAWWATRGNKIEFTAPGVSILSTARDTNAVGNNPHFVDANLAPRPCVPGGQCPDTTPSPSGRYEYFTGSSAAAAFVSGVATLLKSIEPWAELELRGTDLGQDRIEQGLYGLINAKETIER